MRIFLVTLLWLCLCAYAGGADPVEAADTQIGPFILTYGTENGHHPLEVVGHNVDDMSWNLTAPTRDLTGEEKSALEAGISYWAERMAKARPGMTAHIFAGFADDPDGSAFSLSPIEFVDEDIADQVSPDGTVFDALRSGKPSPYPAGLTDNIIIINIPYSTRPQRALLDPDSLAATMMHEMGHALGIWTDYAVSHPVPNKYGRFTPNRFTEWNAHLYDVFGKQAKPGMDIAMDAEDGSRENVFQIYGETLGDASKYKYPTFRGEHVDELTGGAGMPVMGGFSNSGPGLDGANSLGHPGIMQSVMSYGLLRNMVFTELELAMFQDLGYDIDRGLFFGKSYYNEVGGNTQTNALGFGSAQSPNTSGFGVGVHVMRDNLHLTQLGSIHADGYAAAGMRVDGVGNSLSLPAGVTVSADGEQGTGVLVSYGRENTLNLKGKVTALGPDGIGIMCALSDTRPRFFSHMPKWDVPIKHTNIQRRHEAGRLKADLDGPLVRRIDLGGTLMASSAALYIGADAHVAEINVLNGASIHGDIISRWNPAAFADYFQEPFSNYMTDLTFGRMADSEGKAVAGSSDPDFRLRYRGDILGAESLDVRLAGGELNYAGTMRVHSFRMDDQTRLLTEFNNGDAGIIEAKDNVTLAPGSVIGFAPSPLSYGRRLAQGDNAVLRFTQSVPATPALLPSAGVFSIGAFDYQWNGLYWDAPTGAVMVNTTGGAFNNERGGTDACNAKPALSVRTPGLDAVDTRMAGHFGRVGAHGATSSFSGTQEAGTPLGGVWAAPAYDYLRHRGDRRYTIQGTGLTFGLDHFFTENVYMGLALSLDYPRYDSDHAEVDGNGVAGIFYGGVLLPLDLELGFNAAYGHMDFEQKRTVYRNTYHSDYNAETLNFGASIGRRFMPAENFVLRPFADWDYLHSKYASHSERADIYGLKYERVRNNIHRLQVGLEGMWADDDMHLGLKAYWSGLRGDTDGTSASSFVLDPESNRFTAPVDGLDRDSIGLGADAGLRLGENMELRLEYSLLAGKHTTAQQGMVGLRYNF